MREELAFPLPHKLDKTVPVILPTGYKHPPHFVANFDEESLPDICKDIYLCRDDTLDKYDAVSPFLIVATVLCWRRFLSLSKKDYMFFCWMVWLLGCATIINDLGFTTDGKWSGEKAKGV